MNADKLFENTPNTYLNQVGQILPTIAEVAANIFSVVTSRGPLKARSLEFQVAHPILIVTLATDQK
jgi:hypothetical protein